MQVLSRKFTIALVATFLFSFILSLINYTKSVQDYFSFGTLIMTFIVLSAPMFLIVGVVASLVFEKYIHSSVAKFISYIVVGAALVIPYSQYYFQGSEPLRFSILGAVGAALYYLIHWVFHKYIFKQSFI